VAKNALLGKKEHTIAGKVWREDETRDNRANYLKEDRWVTKEEDA